MYFTHASQTSDSWHSGSDAAADDGEWSWEAKLRGGALPEDTDVSRSSAVRDNAAEQPPASSANSHPESRGAGMPAGGASTPEDTSHRRLLMDLDSAEDTSLRGQPWSESAQQQHQQEHQILPEQAAAAAAGAVAARSSSNRPRPADAAALNAAISADMTAAPAAAAAAVAMGTAGATLPMAAPANMAASNAAVSADMAAPHVAAAAAGTVGTAGAPLPLAPPATTSCAASPGDMTRVQMSLLQFCPVTFKSPRFPNV